MELFAALADPTRRRILQLLAERERAAGELAAAFSVSRPAISRHLRVLREAGLIRWRGDAQRRIYRLERDALIPAEQWIEQCCGIPVKRVQRLAAARLPFGRTRPSSAPLPPPGPFDRGRTNRPSFAPRRPGRTAA